jgi:hypothetical protein
VTILPVMNHTLLSLRMMGVAYPGFFSPMLVSYTPMQDATLHILTAIGFSFTLVRRTTMMKPSMPLRHFRRSLRPTELP